MQPEHPLNCKSCRQILLDGHFAGRMVTRMHCLEIAMPVGATLPSTPLLEVLRAVKDANRSAEEESFQQRAKVVESLLAVVEADVDPVLRATEVDEERSDPTITPAEPVGEAVRIRVHSAVPPLLP
ncbi:unnamed protein product [Symbiodinium sp. CCMP2456]|nr:unnamed protein product [Symbiodinium sp. CCMP2456]